MVTIGSAMCDLYSPCSIVDLLFNMFWFVSCECNSVGQIVMVRDRSKKQHVCKTFYTNRIGRWASLISVLRQILILFVFAIDNYFYHLGTKYEPYSALRVELLTSQQRVVRSTDCSRRNDRSVSSFDKVAWFA